jgi:coenzyme PQQ synthesis protein D (PqqD)
MSEIPMPIPPVRLVDYPTAEAYCIQLAGQLRSELGGRLARSKFVAIPRGGLIVLGIFSYALGLERHQIEGWENRGDVKDNVIVVDDCCLSGARFGQVLDRLEARRIFFVHLLSHPCVRKAILDQEPRVKAGLAAGDLTERHDGNPKNPAEFSAVWRKRLPGKRYWIGATEPFAFSWSEPDRVLWNARSGKIEDTWHRCPPKLCLDTRVALDVPHNDTPIGPIDVPAHVFWKLEDGDVTLWHSKLDRVYQLQGVAGMMWRTLTFYGDLETAFEYLLKQYDVDKEELRRDLEVFYEALLAKGLLVKNEYL